MYASQSQMGVPPPARPPAPVQTKQRSMELSFQQNYLIACTCATATQLHNLCLTPSNIPGRTRLPSKWRLILSGLNAKWKNMFLLHKDPVACFLPSGTSLNVESVWTAKLYQCLAAEVDTHLLLWIFGIIQGTAWSLRLRSC